MAQAASRVASGGSIFAKALLDPAKSASGPSAPAYVIALGRWVTLRLAAYSVLLLFLAAGVFSALTRSAGTTQLPSNWVTPVLYVAVYLGALIAHESIRAMQR